MMAVDRTVYKTLDLAGFNCSLNFTKNIIPHSTCCLGYNSVSMSWHFLPQTTPVLGIDLGTSRTRIWCQGKGVVIDQPTMVATHTQTQKVVAVGQAAAEMCGRVTSQIKLHHPIKNGRIFDAVTAKAMLQVWLQQILGFRYLFSPVIMVSVPAGYTQASRQAVIEVLFQLGAREVYTVAQPLAAAIGAGVPIADASGTLVFQLGAGVAEAAVISLGSVVHHRSLELAGDHLDQVLQKQITRQYQLQLGLESVRQLKHRLLWFDPNRQVISVVGQSLPEHLAREVELHTKVLVGDVMRVLATYEELIKSLLKDVYPALIADVLDKGLLLSGGLSQLVGLDSWLAEKLKMPTAVVENPDMVVIEGIKLALGNLDDFKQSFDYQKIDR